MEGAKLVAFLFILGGFQLLTVQCVVYNSDHSCATVNDTSGKIIRNNEKGINTGYSQRCWVIPAPPGACVQLKVNSFTSNVDCQTTYLTIRIAETNQQYTICRARVDKTAVTSFSNVTVTDYLGWPDYARHSNFELEYNITTGVHCISGVSEARKNAVSWLKQQRTASWGWRENTPRAVVALFLASNASFDGTVLEEELMAKQTELKIAVALLRPSLTDSELSMFIHALLVTCHSPRRFHGNDLVRRLKKQAEASRNATHPLAYLALCNANETWPAKAASDLDSILGSDSEYPFVKDLQAMAVTALSCRANHSSSLEAGIGGANLTLYQKTIQHFKTLQAEDGSFGNVYSTALVTQALISSGQEHSKDWKLNATIQYLMKELNSSSVDFLATYLALPVLSGKSLMDISSVNCSANPRKHGDDPTSDISDYLGPKMRVQYSLFIGDEKDVVHTISLRVPENYTAFEVMELAGVEDPKYKCERKTTSGKLYVFDIANVTNDPEAGRFWLLYVGAANNSEALTHLVNGPDEIVMNDGEHLVLWYKTVII